MEVYSVKYALTAGIQKLSGYIADGYFYTGKGFNRRIATKLFYVNLENARFAADKIRIKKIESLKKQIKKLENLKF
jgi:hypothetical protein